MTADTSLTLTDMTLTKDAPQELAGSADDNRYVTDTDGHGNDDGRVKGADGGT